MIAWHSGNNSNSYDNDQYFTRFAPDGTVLCDAVPVNPDGTFNQRYGAVEALPDGSFFIAWEASNDVPGDAVVLMNKYDDQCELVLEELAVSSGAGWDEERPVIETLADGRLLIVWDSKWGDYAYDEYMDMFESPGVRFKIATAEGDFVTDELAANTTLLGLQHKSDVAPLPGGGFVVVWQSATWQNESDSDVYFQRFNSLGEKVGDETIAHKPGLKEQEMPTVASLSNGSFLIAWVNTTNSGVQVLRVRLFDSNGEPVAPEFSLPTPPTSMLGYMNPGLIARSEDAGFVIVWAWENKYPEKITNIWGLMLDPTGTALGEPTAYNAWESMIKVQPSIAPFAEGGWMTTWADGKSQDGAEYGVFAIGHDANGEKRYQ